MKNEESKTCLRPLTMVNEAGDETEQWTESRADSRAQDLIINHTFLSSSDNSCEIVEGTVGRN